MTISIAAQSQCFADWSFIVEWPYNIAHVCKGLWKLPAVNDPNMQELDRSRACALERSSSCMFGLISRKLKQNSLQKSFGFPRSLKGWSCKNCTYFSELSLRLMHLSPDRINSQRLTGCFFLLCDADVSCRFCRSATNAAKRLPECVVWKKTTKQRCPSWLRTVRLSPVSHEKIDIGMGKSMAPFRTVRIRKHRFSAVQQYPIILSNANIYSGSVTLLRRLIVY